MCAFHLVGVRISKSVQNLDASLLTLTNTNARLKPFKCQRNCMFCLSHILGQLVTDSEANFTRCSALTAECFTLDSAPASSVAREFFFLIISRIRKLKFSSFYITEIKFFPGHSRFSLETRLLVFAID